MSQRLLKFQHRCRAALWASSFGAASLTAWACSLPAEDTKKWLPPWRPPAASALQQVSLEIWIGPQHAQMQRADAEQVKLATNKLKCSWEGSHDSGRYKPVVLLACGAFNPPTFMHLRMCELAAEALDRVIARL